MEALTGTRRSVVQSPTRGKTRKAEIETETKNQPRRKIFVSQQESSRAQCLDTALDKEERVRILTRKTLNHQRDVSDAAGVEYRA